MTRRFPIAVAGCASVAATALVATALAAYGSPRLEVTQAGDRVTLTVTQADTDDATAIARIISPLGTEIAAAAPPGTSLGTVSAAFVPAAGGAQVDAQGRLETVATGQTPVDALAGCAAGERVEAVWRLALAAPGLTLDVPMYLLVGGDLLVCLPHPGGAAGGAKLVRLELTLDGPFRLPSTGTWISIWVPYDAGGRADTARIVASPAVVGAGSVSFTAKARGKGALITGIVRQGAAPREGARVRITGGPRPGRQSTLGGARTNRAGRFTFRAKSGTYFRATASVGRTSPPGICFVLEPFLRPIPCVNPSLSGFSVQSTSVRKR